MASKTVGMRESLKLGSHERSSCIDVPVAGRLGVVNHKVHVEGVAEAAGQALDEHGANGEVRHEVAVHHVDVDEVGTVGNL